MRTLRGLRFLVVTLLLGMGGRVGRAEEAPREAGVALEKGLRLGGVSRGARSLIHQDPVEAAFVAGTWTPPRAGDTVVAPDGTAKAWEAVAATGAPPVFEGEAFTAGAYLSFRVPSDTERVAILHGKGHDFVYVNGELRPGDPYGYGWLRLPVLLRKGDNDLLFRVSRGRFSGRLEDPPAEVFLVPEDATLPSCVPGAPEGGLAAIPVLNARRDAPVRVRMRCSRSGSPAVVGAPVDVPPGSVRKVPFLLPAVAPEAVKPGESGDLEVTPLWRTAGRAPGGDGEPERAGPAARLSWPMVRPEDPVRRRTFRSDVDGSVQYYAVNELSPDAVPKGLPPRALVLSLHGAGVEAGAQAASYATKRWATVVCPTNRRPFGFDWEDWGRLDALEVMGVELASGRYDRSRVHVTGHSMGGHGTWHLGVTFPDLFATVAPSAGWISFASYAGGPTEAPGDPVEALLRRAASPGDTLSLVGNLAPKGVYVLHGDADDNVPVSEARTIVERLRGVVPDLHVHEQKGAGHWWDASPDEPGTDCVDWAPVFDLMARRRVPSPDEVRDVDFTTASPGVSSRSAWVEIRAQARSHLPSRVRLRFDPGRRRVEGTTENVARLALHLPPAGGEPVTVALDGGPEVVRGRVSGPEPIVLAREDGRWFLFREGFSTHVKGPERCGPFKQAWRDWPVLVVGTHGTPEETAWAARRARLDAEAWWYRGNGSVDVVDDETFLASSSLPGAPASGGRNVILYGHAEMNAAWDPLLGTGPVRVGRGVVRVGGRETRGDDFACLFLRPRPGSHRGLVAVVAGTGLPGLRLTDRLPYLSSGVAVPDVVVLSASMLAKGAEGLVGAGFFGPDWAVESGEFAWRE